MSPQSTFDAFAKEAELRGEPPDRWGPTMDEPAHWVAPQDSETLPGSTVDQRDIEGTGLATTDFTLVNARISPEKAAEKGYHPDDERRPKRWEEEAEQIAELEGENPHPDAGGVA